MRQSRFTEVRVVSDLRETGRPVTEVAKRHAVGGQTVSAGWKRFGALAALHVTRRR